MKTFGNIEKNKTLDNPVILYILGNKSNQPTGKYVNLPTKNNATEKMQARLSLKMEIFQPNAFTALLGILYGAWASFRKLAWNFVSKKKIMQQPKKDIFPRGVVKKVIFQHPF